MDRLARPRGGGGSAFWFGLILGVALGLIVTVAVRPQPRTQSVAIAPGTGAASGQQPGSSSHGTPVSGARGEQADAPGRLSPSGPIAATPAGTSGAGAGTGRTSARGPGGAPGGASRSVAVRGVTDKVVRIGIAYPDLSLLRYLGPSFDNGDVPDQWRALLLNWKRQGLVPVHGRDVVFVFRKYQALSPEEQRAACTGLIDDDKVFLVIGVLFFDTGRECVAREKKTILITADGPTDETFARSHPYLFSISASESRHLRNFVHWAHRKRLLEGKKIGLYYQTRADLAASIQQNVRGTLRRLGYSVAVEMQSPNERGGPEDAIAVQRFRSAGVDLAMLFTSKTGFMQQARAQDYKPMYIDSDYYFGTSDTATSTYPPEQFDGSYAMTGRRVGEVAAGMPQDAETRACVRNYERHANKRLTPDSTEYGYVLYSCDEGKVMLYGLQQAGRDLTPQRYIRALETVRDMRMTRYAPITFTPTKHHGGEGQRTVRWDGRGCRCWKAIGRMEPLFVP